MNRNGTTGPNKPKWIEVDWMDQNSPNETN